MPFYEYQCARCGHHLEAMQKVSDAPLKKCPDCGKSALQRLMSAPVFRLKGSGWYETDFKSDKDSKRNLAGAEREGKGEESKAAAPEAAKGAEAKPTAKPDAGATSDKPTVRSGASSTPARAGKRTSVARAAARPARPKARPAARRKGRR